MPSGVASRGGNYLNPHIADVMITNMDFPTGVKAHIIVSWLHPYKEQQLVVVGNPARVVGWMSEAGRRLEFDKDGVAFCEKSQKRYKLENGVVREIR